MAVYRSETVLHRPVAIAVAIAAVAAVAVIVAIAVRAPTAGSKASATRGTPALAVAAARAEARVLVARAATAVAASTAGAADRDPPAWVGSGSEAEQDQLDDYADGIDNVAPLDDSQRTQLLAAKLRYKATFERELGAVGLERPALTVDERARAYAIVNEAVDRYRDSFLRDAAAFLDDEQSMLLTSYETTEMERERQQLQIAINLK